MKRTACELTSLDQCRDTVDTMWHSSSEWYVETFRYLNGNITPHYPVPATDETSSIANNHVWLTRHCPDPDGPCCNCISEYLDGLEETLFIVHFGY